MRIIDLLRMSAESLFKRKVRTILTVLGVIIGTTSIVVMISLGIGMKNSMMESVESYGNMKMIEVYEPGRYGMEEGEEELRLDDALIETISHMEHVEMVSPALEVSVLAKCGSYESYLWLRGMELEALEQMDIPFAQGGLPESGDPISFIYGNGIIGDFYNARTGSYEYWENGILPDIDLYEDSIYIIFDMDRYYMAGSTDENGQIIPQPKKYIVETSGVVAGGVDEYNNFSYSVYCDIEALKLQLQQVFKGRVIPGQPTQASGKPYNEIFYNSVYVYVDEMENVTDVQNQIIALGYETYAEAEWIESEMQQMNIIQAVLGGIGAVSLFVAAIGITNTMMMSIYERTKEIGIMKVIGCRIRDIQIMFLMEAGYIGLLGGAIGVAFSYGLSALVNYFVGMALGVEKLSQIPLWLALVSILFAIVVGMVSGLLPSIRAMRLSPLAAIRENG